MIIVLMGDCMGRFEAFFRGLINAKLSQNPEGIVSICSSNPYVLKSFFKSAVSYGGMLLIESTSNQVNQYGGYTGMKPIDFRNYVFKLAEEYKIEENRIILGGDHLGPNPFKNSDNKKAMEEACNLVVECVKAGYKKIHLDASMPLRGDYSYPVGHVDLELAGERAAILCKASENALIGSNNTAEKPLYVIGTEVPAPGGSSEVERKGKTEVTSPGDLKNTIETTKNAFLKYGLEKAWNRVIAVVCQPGVEFGEMQVLDYDRNRARELAFYIKGLDHLVGEAHSTDYQTAKHLRELVEDGFSILKVGPELTYALREALFSLSFIEDELIENEGERSALVSVLENVMIENPRRWETHYLKGSKVSLKYSLFDRIRYYWNDKRVIDAVRKLFKNLRSRIIPLSLLSQFLPVQYWKIREGKLKLDPLDIILDKIDEIIQKYYFATKAVKNNT